MDTTGAGDAFVSEMLAAWYRGHDWATADCFVNAAVGAMATTELGAAKGVEGWDEVLRLAIVPPHRPAHRD